MRNMKQILIHAGSVLLIVVALTLSGCYAHEHVVGTGPQTGLSETKKQWYVAYGLAPITEVDTREMAQGAANYTIKTEQSFIDSLIGGITLGLLTPRTVTVTR